jgi:hypothetical protein
MVVEGLPAPDLVIAEMQEPACVREQGAKAFFPLLQRPRAKGLAIEMEEIEQKEDQRLGVTRV